MSSNNNLAENDSEQDDPIAAIIVKEQKNNPRLISYYGEAMEDLEKVRILVGDKNVTEIHMIHASCGERFPCSGHKGVTITFDTDDKIDYDCGPVSIGAIMVFYKSLNAKTSSHCSNFINDEFEARILRYAKFTL